MKPQNIKQPKKGQKQAVTMQQKKNNPLKGLLIGVAVILGVTFMAFSPSLTGELLGWDDQAYIRDNPLIRTLTLENMAHVFNYKTVVVGNYHPLTVLTYMIEYQVAGAKPFIYHFDNLLLHLFNILVVSWLVWLLTKKQMATLLCSALFALHPMRVESVVWAAERKDVLYTFFFLLSLVSYVYFLRMEKRKTGFLLLSILFYILSILSKGQAVVLPLVLFLLDYWYGKKINLKSVLVKVPFLALSLLAGMVALLSQHSSLTEHRLTVLSNFERGIIALYNLSAYLFKLVFPFNLSAFYQYPAPGQWGLIYAGAATTLVMAAMIVYFLRKEKTIVFGTLFYVATISIVIQILPVGNAILADRYTYIPYLGLFFILAVLTDRFFADKKKATIWLALPAAILLVFTIGTYSRATEWHNDETLWKSALEHNPGNVVAGINLGHYYIEKERFEDAVPLLLHATRGDETYTDIFNAYQNLGVAYSRTERHAEALQSFKESLARRPGYFDAIFSMGISYTALGLNDSAVSCFTNIIRSIDSLNPKTYYSRGVAYNKLDRPDLAIADYTTAIRLDPQYADPYINRGNIYFGLNKFDLAIADYTDAIGLNPNEGKSFMNRSFVYFRAGKYNEALQDALKAKELKMEVHPRYVEDLEKAIAAGSK